MAFVLFDTDADGKLTFEEVSMYMASVLRVVYAVSEDVEGAMLLVTCYRPREECRQRYTSAFIARAWGCFTRSFHDFRFEL